MSPPSQHDIAGADRVCNSEAQQVLFGLAAGVLVAAATASDVLLGTMIHSDGPPEMRHSEAEAAAMAVVLGANLQNAMQSLQQRPRAVASRQVGLCCWGCLCLNTITLVPA